MSSSATVKRSDKEAFMSSTQHYPQELLLFQVTDVAVKITSVLRQVLGASGITPTELRVLAFCIEEDRITAADISSRSIFRSAGVSRAVDKLVQMGLLVREDSSKDRRLSILRPTELAFEFAMRLCPTVERIQSDAVASLTTEEVDNLRSWMTSISNTLDGLEQRNYI